MRTANIYYQDREGNQDHEYISLGYDDAPVLPDGRTPVQAYRDFMQAFRSDFAADIGDTITNIEVMRVSVVCYCAVCGFDFVLVSLRSLTCLPVFRLLYVYFMCVCMSGRHGSVW